ncbi:MAG TPA: DNA-processing protein DprA [Candidatus Dojkabacteria bacterium]|nr:DNA-processing protein DprA [Candidatus Dojkabacteria bacterium]HQF36675.1 DNA-processing protein DprA [Candidatus Dojkabacteria bacterium]
MIRDLISFSDLSDLDRLFLRLRGIKGIGNVKLWNITNALFEYTNNWVEYRKEICDSIVINCKNESIIDFNSVLELLDVFNDQRQVDDGELLIEMKRLWGNALRFGCRYRVGYPVDLLKMKIPPVFISTTGFIPDENIKIGVVGTRKMTEYGRDIIMSLVKVLKQYNCTIFTGFADGIDWVTFESALRYDIYVCGVIPWCLSRIPNYKFDLISHAIRKNKCLLVSEYDGIGEVTNGNFLVRNEMLASIVDILIVVEAPYNSGTLHTVNYAMKMSKPIGVFPANIFSFSSEGSNKLLADSRINVLYSLDEVERTIDLVCGKLLMSSEIKKVINNKSVDPITQKIFDILENSAITLDELVNKLNIDANSICKILTKLEIEGIVKTDKLGHIRLL